MHESFIQRQAWNASKAFLHNMWSPVQLLLYSARLQENMRNVQFGRNNLNYSILRNRYTSISRTILPSLANKRFRNQGHLSSPKQYTRNLAVTIGWGVWGSFCGWDVTNVMALLKRDGGSDVMHAVLNFIAWPRSDCFSHYPHWPYVVTTRITRAIKLQFSRFRTVVPGRITFFCNMTPRQWVIASE